MSCVPNTKTAPSVHGSTAQSAARRPSQNGSNSKPTISSLYDIDTHNSMALALKVEHLRAVEAQRMALEDAMRPKNHKPTSHDEDEIIDEFPTLPSTNVEDRFDWSDVNRRSKLQFTE
eukprot:GDKK01040917.1.p1 GENE.GDKK01040917.1~~GDKK01040917.1.p1  ORF type:complete len:118 (-),score=9.43 GDKK01040917.1:27-380(-)